jgi:CheY-like chemotaxis protein
VLCIDNEPTILDGMEMLLGGWGCRVVKAADLTSALAALAEQARAGCTAHRLSSRRGERHRGHCAIAPPLRGSDRDPDHRRSQRRCGSSARSESMLNKPVKPAALRALLAQSRVHRVAAAE